MAERGMDAGLRLPTIVAWPLLGAGLLAITWGAYYVGRSLAPGPAPLVTSGPRIEDVRKIAKLAVLRVQVANVIEGRNAGGRAAVLVKGDADLTIDLDGIRLAERDEAARTAVVRLPQPRPDRPRVDHERTRVYQLEKTGLAAINPFADPRASLLEDAMRAAQMEVDRAVQDGELIARAREQAELLLTGFYREMGWTVRIEWVDGAGGTEADQPATAQAPASAAR
ncbi:MAG: DUF4230 domain-containing protein [Planctomycetota bacterium]